MRYCLVACFISAACLWPGPALAAAWLAVPALLAAWLVVTWLVAAIDTLNGD